ncbi:MAG: ferredoxin--NADP(+) reductase [Candidatus Dasytiphilus stammeri]
MGSNWVVAKVIQVIHWTDNLFTLKVHATISPFIAGQFTKIAFEIQINNRKKRIQRAYSYVNAPSNNDLEFYIVTVKDGKLSPYLHNLKLGSELLISKEACGFFVLKEIPSCNNLWMLATGTGIGPYLSILQEGKDLERFQHIILVHAVRYAKDLCYLTLMQQLKEKFNKKLKIQTIVSREYNSGSLLGRIPALIADGQLEQALNIQLDPQNSHVMLCGNPNMVRETQEILQKVKKMNKHLRHGKDVGHITTEHYW